MPNGISLYTQFVIIHFAELFNRYTVLRVPKMRKTYTTLITILRCLIEMWTFQFSQFLTFRDVLSEGNVSILVENVIVLVSSGRSDFSGCSSEFLERDGRCLVSVFGRIIAMLLGWSSSAFSLQQTSKLRECYVSITVPIDLQATLSQSSGKSNIIACNPQYLGFSADLDNGSYRTIAQD